MQAQLLRGAAWAVPAACVALLVGGVVLELRAQDAALLQPEALVNVPLGLGFATVGALIVTRRPELRLGWLYLLAGSASSVALFVYPYAYYGLVAHPGSLPGALFAGWVSAWVWILGFSPALTFGLLLFPDGRLPSRRWWPAILVSSAGVLLPLVAAAFASGPLTNHPIADNPVGIPGSRDLLLSVGSAGPALILVGFAAGVASLVLRWRRSPGGRERKQVSLLACAAGLMFVAVLLSRAPGAVGFASSVIGGAFVPTAIGVAILRYRLYDIDVVLNRSLVYGALTACVTAVYAGGVVGLGLVFGGAQPSTVTVVGTALVVAVVLPLRTSLQRLVNRLMYGDRDDPYVVVSRLGAQLSSASAPGESVQAVVDTLARSLRLPWVAVESWPSGRCTHAGHRSGCAPARIPLVHQGALVGTVLVEGRDRKPLHARDLHLLEGLATHVAAAVDAARLADELLESRQRLVSAREEERRRLRRDLHDGLGPTLAGVALGLEFASTIIETDPPGARRLLADLKNETTASIADVRRLVYDLRPPALDEFGLVAALRQHADRVSLRDGVLLVSVEVPCPLPRLSAATEVAAYRIALEALTNAAQHGQARHCRLSLRFAQDLEVEVVDDGTGLSEDYRPGVGLAGMRERAEELGGRCAIGPADPTGTRVLVSLPLEQG